jgi:hypothetical protein
MSRKRFAAEALDLVRRHPGIQQPELDLEAFAIRFGEGESKGWIYLDNVYRETASWSRAERGRRIRRVLAGLVEDEHPALWPAVKSQLRPVVRGSAFGLQPSRSIEQLSRPAMPYLSEFVVVDRPTSMAYVTPSQVAQWGVDAAEVFAAARANIAPAAAGAVMGDTSGERRLLRFVDDGNAYFTSWLLVDGFLAGMAEHVGGQPIAFIPDVSTLVIAPEPLDPRLATLMYDQYEQAPRGLSPVAYTVDSRGAVVPYQVGEPGEVRDRVHQAQLKLAAAEYAQQTAVLRAEFERSGTDIFVGEPLVVQPPSGSPFSVCVWPDDCDSLLPEAEFVGFNTPDGPMRVPWPVVRREVGLSAEPGYAPPRYRVTDTPPSPVMARLLADSVGF